MVVVPRPGHHLYEPTRSGQSTDQVLGLGPHKISGGYACVHRHLYIYSMH